jgi:uncharacterized protein YndB with AHSA1/START domain
MPAPNIEQGDRVRFTYTLPGDTRPSTLEGKITAFMFKSQKAVIETTKNGTLTVPIKDIFRKLS